MQNGDNSSLSFLVSEFIELLVDHEMANVFEILQADSILLRVSVDDYLVENGNVLVNVGDGFLLGKLKQHLLLERIS